MSAKPEIHFPDDMTLGEARELLRTVADRGHACPTCTQFVKVYKRLLNAPLGFELIAMYRAYGTEWGDVTKLGFPGGGFAKLRFWGMIEQMPGVRDDGSHRVGWWRVTEKGAEFAKGNTRQPRYARVFNNRCLGLGGDDVWIHEALGKKFDYNQLMYGEGS